MWNIEIKWANNKYNENVCNLDYAVAGIID